MKLGLIARAEDRGLGIQTWEVFRHLRPARVLLIDPGDLNRGFAVHRDRYATPLEGGSHKAEVTTLAWAGGELDERPVRTFLRGLDVVYTAETFYDWRIPEWAAEMGVGVVCHVNPELWPAQRAALPVTWWAPTGWRLEHLPARTRVVPMPVAADRFAPAAPADAPVTFLHVAGHRAAYDRNGTTTVFQATRAMRSTCRVIVRGQDEHLPVELAHGPGVELITEAGGVANYWRLYGDAHVLVMPRRYGGLCLPVQEAAAAGLGLVLAGCAPNHTWPGVHLPTRQLREVNLPAGRVPLHEVDPGALAEALDHLAGHPEAVRALQAESHAWAAAHSWSALTERWLAELDAARRR